MVAVPESASDLVLRLKNTAASAAVVTLACTAYGLAPFHQQQLQKLYGPPSIAFTGHQFLSFAAGVYILLLAMYMLTVRDAGVSKSLRFVRFLTGFVKSPLKHVREGLAPDDRLALLTTLLKAFFGPLMMVSLMIFCVGAWTSGKALLEIDFPQASIRGLFDRFGFWFLLQVIFFVDVFIFTVGYLVESRRLGNEIRSVDPTLIGWAAALVCYPPFNSVTHAVLGSPVETFPQFDNTTIHIALNLLMLFLLAVYASASVALGLKASNLTHRGIVTRGPYAVIRHPAYTCKNMAWWIGSMPLIMTSFDRSLFDGLQSIASVAGWTLVYALRALTEEDHLRRVDGAYAEYAANVRCRFIPGLF